MTDLKAIMDRDERRRRMINDPDLTGDVLLLALALDEVITNRTEAGRRRSFGWDWTCDIETELSEHHLDHYRSGAVPGRAHHP